MINEILLVSIGAALFALFFAAMAVRSQKRVQILQKEWDEKIDELRKQQESTCEMLKRYEDLSSGPRYREYGDLS